MHRNRAQARRILPAQSATSASFSPDFAVEEQSVKRPTDYCSRIYGPFGFYAETVLDGTQTGSGCVADVPPFARRGQFGQHKLRVKWEVNAKSHYAGINPARPQSLPRKGLSNDDKVANTRITAATERTTATAPSERLRSRRRIRVRHCGALDRVRADIISGKNLVAMNHLVTLGPHDLLTMPGNRIQEIRECYQQAAHCVQQAEAQNDPIQR
jgi:hypothetical protein